MIYIVEDDEFIRDGMLSLLMEEGYQVQGFCTLEECEKALSEEIPELMVLDALLPDGNGFDFCKKLRESYSFPVLFLTCCDEEYNTVRGFESGADDYVTKPFRVKELLLRIRALLRRSGQAFLLDGEQIKKQEGYVIDLNYHQVFLKGENIGLTPTEFLIFAYLYKKRGKLVSRRELLYDVWDLREAYIDENTLNVHISGLRKKLGEEGGKLETVRGIGYRLNL